jgi:hypothetical protein
MIAHSMDSMDDLDSRKGLAMLEDIYNRLWGLIEARSVAYGDDPVGKTGLYSRTLKIRGTRDPVLFEEYVLDRQLISKLLKTMKYIAIQTDQWKPSQDSVEKALFLEKLNRRIEAGRERVAKLRAERAAEEAVKKETQPEERLGE